MKRILKYILLLITTCASFSHILATDFKAEAPTTVIAGEKFRVVYSIDKQGSDFRLGTINDMQILMGPSISSSSGLTSINGKTELFVNYSYTFILKCDKPGKYTIPPASISIDGKRVESNSVTIEVIKGDDASRQQSTTENQTTGGISDEDIFIKITPNKTTAYKDEPIILTTKLYVKPQVNVQGITDQILPDLKEFISKDLEVKNEQQYENINGKTYISILISQKLVYPQKTGKLKIDPTEFELSIKQRVARRSRSIFDDFFESNYRTIKKRVKSKPLSLNVKTFPSAEPIDFSGIVGSVTMKVTASKTEVKTNDGVTIKIEISGTGNHKVMATPNIQIPADFDKFDPKVNNNFNNTPKGMVGTKTYEYLIIPRHSGKFEIPPITISYFDLNTKTFKQLSSKAISINVEKGNMEETTSTITTPYAASREELKFIGKDIRYIKTSNNELRPIGVFYLGSKLFFLMIIIPAILFIIFILVLKKQIKENSDIVKVKNKKANKVAQKRLKNAHSLLKKNEKEAFYDEVLRALWGYMSDKLTLPVAQLSKENASTLMGNFEVKSETIAKFMEILDTCEFARYAPSTGNTEMGQLYNETIETITLLESQIKI
ncbi:MAG: protein BatD [Marinilabiliaceae bacterium]|nr:protein BatD [Marinilabiliaceae bacterium]